MGFQTVAPGSRRLDGGDAIFQHDVMSRYSNLKPAIHRRCINVHAGQWL
jgi:hypothetical protein